MALRSIPTPEAKPCSMAKTVKPSDEEWIKHDISKYFRGNRLWNRGTKKENASEDLLVPEAGLEPARAVKPEGF